MTLLTRAIAFAAQAHEGMCRKGTDIPYIVHPMEAAAIASTITDDECILAAAVLHDVMEDCGVCFDSLCAAFGERVAELVDNESHTPHPDMRASWLMRKQETIGKIARAGRDSQIIALADKLSNMRAIHRDWRHEGEALFLRFNQHDKRLHAWYYRSCCALLRDRLGDTDAWRELNALIEDVFADAAPVCSPPIDGCAV
ncbi:MAG: bifunctional (p)ppGpp synthetase/guanosine-3',5'-bis(diphosphate) 3'-pyrophosphohydrolase [Clostridia bacterium]|nr:bifunctional (p)ppGpp synthetase/guanosine-3',5'-bis(diphosphate) 3'-pyrophosphohydrolase [Clostridia bacterium]